jgi:hypothetical protein
VPGVPRIFDSDSDSLVQIFTGPIGALLEGLAGWSNSIDSIYCGLTIEISIVTIDLLRVRRPCGVSYLV